MGSRPFCEWTIEVAPPEESRPPPGTRADPRRRPAAIRDGVERMPAERAREPSAPTVVYNHPFEVYLGVCCPPVCFFLSRGGALVGRGGVSRAASPPPRRRRAGGARLAPRPPSPPSYPPSVLGRAPRAWGGGALAPPPPEGPARRRRPRGAGLPLAASRARGSRPSPSAGAPRAARPPAPLATRMPGVGVSAAVRAACGRVLGLGVGIEKQKQARVLSATDGVTAAVSIYIGARLPGS